LVNDNLPKCIATVGLRLAPPPLDPPTYEIGRPARAGAVILDNDHPLFLREILSDAGVHLRLTALDGMPFRLESSQDLLIVVEEGVSFVEAEIPGQPFRFFRVVAEYGDIEDD